MIRRVILIVTVVSILAACVSGRCCIANSCNGTAIQNNINELNEAVSNLQNQISSTGGSSSGISPVPTSCMDIKRQSPSSKSGIYLIIVKGSAQYVFCNMDTLCGSEGGWTRVINLDMTDASQDCPKSTTLQVVNGIRICTAPSRGSGSCCSFSVPTLGLSYTEVCGRARGYQIGTPDAFFADKTIDSFYVDGVSLTIGNPRQHLWTFAGGISEQFSEGKNKEYMCPCNTNSVQAQEDKIPSFVGSNFYCESGSPAEANKAITYTSDPLWDGKQCGGGEGPCCTNDNLPWFHRTLDSSVAEPIEARLCRSYPENENVCIDQLEIYIK